MPKRTIHLRKWPRNKHPTSTYPKQHPTHDLTRLSWQPPSAVDGRNKEQMETHSFELWNDSSPFTFFFLFSNWVGKRATRESPFHLK